jgi:hypothetical protein
MPCIIDTMNVGLEEGAITCEGLSRMGSQNLFIFIVGLFRNVLRPTSDPFLCEHQKAVVV